MEQVPSIELRLLRYFVAVAEELNYRRAARRLNISAPSLSAQIKQLESLLDARLLERDTVRVRLTVMGEALLREARALLEHAHRMISDIQKMNACESEGVLQLGHFGSFSQNFFSEALDVYKKRFPEQEIALTDIAAGDEQAEMLANDVIQVGFVLDEHLQRMKDIEHLLVYDLPICAVMSRRHPLAALEEVDVEEVVEYPLLATPRFHKRLLNILARFGVGKSVARKIRVSENLNACVSGLIAGRAVAVLPEVGVLKQNSKLALSPIKNMPGDLRLQIYAAWKKARETPRVVNFIEVLRDIGVQRE